MGTTSLGQELATSQRSRLDYRGNCAGCSARHQTVLTLRAGRLACYASPSGWPAAVFIATFQIPFEFFGDLFTGGLGELFGVACLLQLFDIRGDIRIFRREFIDPALPRGGIVR